MEPIRDPNHTYWAENYNTPIPVNREIEYAQWLGNRNPKDIQDYDIQGAFLSGAQQAPNGHGPDTFKKPNHPTFSTESQYHGAAGYQGGQWIKTKDGRGEFAASPDNVTMHGAAGLQKYFNAREPNVGLKVPDATSIFGKYFDDAVSGVKNTAGVVGGLFAKVQQYRQKQATKELLDRLDRENRPQPQNVLGSRG